MDLHGSALISSLGSTMLLTVAKEATGQTWNFVSRLAGESLKHGQTPTAPGRGASVAVGSVCTVRIGGSSTCPKGWGERGTDGWMVWIGFWIGTFQSFLFLPYRQRKIGAPLAWKGNELCCWFGTHFPTMELQWRRVIISGDRFIRSGTGLVVSFGKLGLGHWHVCFPGQPRGVWGCTVWNGPNT